MAAVQNLLLVYDDIDRAINLIYSNNYEL